MVGVRQPPNRTRCCVAALVMLSLIGEPAAAGDPAFTDQTAAAGLLADHDPSPWLVVSDLNVSAMLGGGAVGDFNGDGYQDVFFLSGGVEPDKLFINNGDGTFSELAADWGVAYAHMGVGTAVGDYNGDGRLDIFVTSLGPAVAPTQPGQHLLYRNDGGAFTNVAGEAGVSTTSLTIADSFGAAFGDYDGDGDLDLFVAGWVPGSGGNRLFQNEGDGTFTDATSSALTGIEACRGFSPRFADMDGDGDADLLLAADFGTSRYYVNNGDASFTDMTVASGTGLDGNGMGQAIGDFNGDGRLDWYVTSIYSPMSQLPGVPGTGNMLYINDGGNIYNEQSVSAGVNNGGWGWGTVAVDVDHDGLIDIVETNGWGQDNGTAGPEWLNIPSYLFRNLGGGIFEEIGAASGITHAGNGRGLAAIDYDNDGDQDLIIFSYDEPLRLYRNEIAGSDCHWLRIRLDTSATTLAPDGFGARILLSVDGATQIRSVDGGASYLVQSELPAHFGLGGATQVDQLTVAWADGTVSRLYGIAADQMLVVEPGQYGADLDGDGQVGITDFLFLLSAWGACPDPPDPCPGDIDADGLVGITDFLIVLADWGLQ